jgi:integrase
MPTEKLSEKRVASVQPPQSGRLELWDALVPGFGLRVTDKGAKSWCVMYRHAGVKKRLTLGAYPAKSLADAREAAREALRKVERNVDPVAERKAAKAAPPPRVDTFESVVAEFMKRHVLARGRRDANGTQRIFEKHVLSRWRDRDMKSIRKRDVIELLDAIVDQGTPIAANRVLAHVRKLFNWALERDIVEATPIGGIKPPSEENRRDRVLADEELFVVWKAAGTLGYPFGHFHRMLIATAQRRTEVASMRRADIDRSNGLWTIAAKDTKADRVHVVPLSALALCILDELPQAGPYLFTTTGVGPIAAFAKAKVKLDEAAAELRVKAGRDPLSAWILHDLRRTASTGMARLKVPRFIIERVLNHADRTVTGRYDRYEYLDEKRDALERWGKHVEYITAPTEKTTSSG